MVIVKTVHIVKSEINSRSLTVQCILREIHLEEWQTEYILSDELQMFIWSPEV